MSFFIYISHRNVVQALTVGEELMKAGHYPFIPQLNRLIEGRSAQEWENYFKMWILKCDVLYLTPSHRPHERMWAMEDKRPIVSSMKELEAVKLPQFGELGRKFGEEVALGLDKKESWRNFPKEDITRAFESVCGLGSKPLEIGRLALQTWDRERNG